MSINTSHWLFPWVCMTHSYHNTLIDPIPRSQNNTTQMKTQGEERVWFNLSLPLVAGHLWQCWEEPGPGL